MTTTAVAEPQIPVTAFHAWLRAWQTPLWLALVVALFCAPLFYGLGRTDLNNDESIYAYAVDSILESGDWLNPRSSPNGDLVFLEKPPLKFWLIALPMRVGLLPHNELGFRLWDALFGSAAFLYVFALGRRLFGPVCGLIALVVLVGFQPLLFEHGLRDSVMEAPLFLAYCGGIYHFLRWSDAKDPRSARRHALAVGLLFVLGFMTKFVAVLFLPMILAATSLCIPALRTRLVQEWKRWAGVSALALVVIVPWFVYQAVVRGRFLWKVMFSTHVVQRLTATLHPDHLQPWYFYATTLYVWARGAGVLWIGAAGLVLLALKSLRERRPEGASILIWFTLPILLMSAGTSKLLYYAYPFMPPLALAFASALCWMVEVSRKPLDGLVARLVTRSGWQVMPRSLRIAFAALCGLLAVVAVVTAVQGSVEIWIGSLRVYRNQTILRPTIFALLCGLVSVRGLAGLAPVARIVFLSVLVPISAYTASVSRTAVAEDHTLRTTRDCVLAVRDGLRQAGRPVPPLLAAMPQERYNHSFFFYMRDAGYDQVFSVSDDTLAEAFHRVGRQRPVMMAFERYVDITRKQSSQVVVAWPPALSMWKGVMPAVDEWIGQALAVSTVDPALANIQILLPGPYAVCGEPRWGPMLQPLPGSARKGYFANW